VGVLINNKWRCLRVLLIISLFPQQGVSLKHRSGSVELLQWSHKYRQLFGILD